MTSVAPRQQPTRAAPTDSYVLVRVLLFMMVCVTLDTRDFLSHGGKARYILLVIPFGVTLFLWNRKKKGIVRRMSVPDRILAVLTLVGLGRRALRNVRAAYLVNDAAGVPADDGGLRLPCHALSTVGSGVAQSAARHWR